MKSTVQASRSVILFLLAAVACAGPVGKDGAPGANSDGGPSADAGSNAVDYGVLTPGELQVAKIAAVVSSVTIPADGQPVVKLTVTERHGSGVKGMSATAVTWRFALLKLVPGLNSGTPGVNGSANDTWVSYLAANDHSVASTETATATTLTDNGDGTYNFRFAKVVTAGVAAAGTTYDPTQIHRLVILLFAAGNPFTPLNLIKEFVPSTGVDVTGQNDKVDGAACLECHTTFRAIADEVGALGGGEFHSGVRFDVRACAACHNDQKRFVALSSKTVNDSSIAADGTWPGSLAVLNGEAVVNFPVFIHKIHMGTKLALTGTSPANPAGGTYTGFPQPYQTTFPQDIRNCVKCHRAPAALADNFKNQPSRRACAACHDDISFINPPPNARTLHTGGAMADDRSCVLCHSAGGVAGDIPSQHLAVSPPNPNNLFLNPTATGNANTNAAFVAAAGLVPPGAHAISYVVSSVSTWTDTVAAVQRPQIVFKIKLDGTDVVFPDPANATELIPHFVGAPSAFFAFAVPQDGIAAPADFNAQASAYLRNVWNGTGTCSNAAATTTRTGGGILTGPDAGGFYTFKLTCAIVPAAATMLTGGIGYTYSLGSLGATNFLNNNQPFTEIDLPAYPYTPNASGQAGKGGLIVPAPDISMVATGFTARRAIVANSTCDACHVSLGVGPDFHAGQRNDAGTCNFCHVPNRTSSGWSANMKDFVHSLHSADKRATDGGSRLNFTWQEVSPTDGYWQVTYPGVLNHCEMCHLPGTSDFSLAATTDALPNMLASTAGTGTYAAGSNHSPFVTEGTAYGAVFAFNAVTGVSTEAAPTTLVTSPIMAACSACHVSPAAIDHMQTNGGSYWAVRSDVQASPQGEQCLVCHGPNRIASISLVHTDLTP